MTATKMRSCHNGRISVVLTACILASSAVFLITLVYALSLKEPAESAPKQLELGIEGSDVRLLFNHTLRLPIVCADEICRADYVRYLQVNGMHPIPAIRHILWKSEVVSAYFAEQLRSWQRIHPDWTYVLWRDRDLEPFVATYFPGLLAKFRSLADHIMRVDMIRHLLLFKYGGIYADLDYTLARSLNDFRRFPAVLTREPDAHSLEFFGPSWPVKVLANPAFMMSSPGHAFYRFATLLLSTKVANGSLFFAGPLGLTDILERYSSQFPVANSAMETVYVPPSRSFYPYIGNRLNSSRSAYLALRFSRLNRACQSVLTGDPKMRQWKRDHPLRRFCADVNNMDPITDQSQPVFAVHDLNKAGAAYDGVGGRFYSEKLMDIRLAVPQLKLGLDFMLLV